MTSLRDPPAPALSPLPDDPEARACFEALAASAGLPPTAIEQALRVLDLTADAVILVDASRRIIYSNRRASEISGYSPAELGGRECVDGLRFETCATRCSLFEDGGVCERSCQLRGKSGDLVMVVKNARLLRDASGRVVGGIESFQDVTGLQLQAPMAAAPAADPPRGGDRDLLAGIVAVAPVMRELVATAVQLAQNDVTVLIIGESGVGKEMVARVLHLAGPRRERPLHAVNCAALSEQLLESELFGHERGAFTGAVQSKPGRLELCGDGTLLLDEIGCMPVSTQAKLLRVLEQREFERVGGTRTLQLQARVVAATNADLGALVRKGEFRADLYYRLRVVPLEVPPLRRRREDILPLARHFARELAGAASPAGEVTFNEEAERALLAYCWPGNVRELRNAVHYALATGKAEGAVIGVLDLPPDVRLAGVVSGSSSGPCDERGRIEAALHKARYSRSQAAALLGISRTTLWRKMRELGLD